ncbi:MAG: hypothetical protein J0M18_20225 [Ignavibacteria bacterium]|nr:hypothetical protein [Ignavibacteria bacterium]
MSSNQSVQESPTAPRVPSQLNTSFFQRVDGIDETVSSESTGKKSKDKSVTKAKSGPPKESKILKQSDKHLVNIISREIKYKDLNERMLKSKQENVFIKEVSIESEIDYINSLKQLKGVIEMGSRKKIPLTKLRSFINRSSRALKDKRDITKSFETSSIKNKLKNIVKKHGRR